MKEKVQSDGFYGIFTFDFSNLILREGQSNDFGKKYNDILQSIRENQLEHLKLAFFWRDLHFL